MKPIFLIQRIPVIAPIILLFFCTNMVFAHANMPTMAGDENLKITLAEESKALIKMFSVNDDTNQVDIVTNKEIVSIQVVDDMGEIIYFLPVVGSDELNVGTSLFKEGTYYIRLVFEGENSFVSARVDKI